VAGVGHRTLDRANGQPKENAAHQDGPCAHKDCDDHETWTSKALDSRERFAGAIPFRLGKTTPRHYFSIMPLSPRWASTISTQPSTTGRTKIAMIRPRSSLKVTTGSRPNTRRATTAIKPRTRRTANPMHAISYWPRCCGKPGRHGRPKSHWHQSMNGGQAAIMRQSRHKGLGGPHEVASASLGRAAWSVMEALASVLQIGGSMRGNTGFLGFAL